MGDIVDAFDGSARRFREERKCRRWGVCVCHSVTVSEWVSESVGIIESSNLN